MQNDQPAVTDERPPPSTIRSLAADFSLEVTPNEAKKHPGVLRDALSPGTRVYITFLAGKEFAETVAAVTRIVEEGMVPVPHVATRAVRDRVALDMMIGQLADVGVTEILAIGGSIAKPAGEYRETAQILESGVLERHGIRRIGVAGHPEGNPDVDDPLVSQALVDKNRIARECGLDLHIVTQFCFAAEPIVAWERRIRADGNRLPITIGLPGLASPAALVKFGIACGVGASLKVLRKQSGGLLKMATKSVYRPDSTVDGIARSLQDDPASLIRGLHYFPFGTLERTSAWARALEDGAVSAGDPLAAVP